MSSSETRRSLLAAAAALVPALALSGCGFQLQGRTPLPSALAVVWIEAQDSRSDFVQALRQALRGAGARLAARSGEATAVVVIERDSFSERVLSVSGRNLPREYELIYSVRFAVRRAAAANDAAAASAAAAAAAAASSAATELLAPEDLTATRQMSFDERAALAKEREKDVQREALARDLVAQVMRRISTLR